MVVGSIEERLKLGPSKRAPSWPPLVLRDMGCGVPLMTNLNRCNTDPLLTLRDPSITGITDVVQEHRQRTLIAANR
jgi:hypothetical protein